MNDYLGVFIFIFSVDLLRGASGEKTF